MNTQPIILSLCLQWIWITCSSCDHPPGHMMPLGSHMTPRYVETVFDFLDPLSFHSNHVNKKWPIIFKGLLHNTDVFKNWQSDKYLKNHFGDEMIGAENGKKENRSHTGELFKFSDFLDHYNTSDIYMVQEMPDSMKEEWVVPSFLLCGGYTDNLAHVHMWFSSGGTKSVLHSDSFENFHCVVSGRKEFVLFEQKYSQDIGPEHQKLGYYHIDVEAVDMTKYPNISTIPWYKATVNEGDCLYLPYLWLHHVDSYGRNLGVNIWWIPFEFNENECKQGSFTAGFAQLSDFSVNSELPFKQFLSENLRPDGTIHPEDVYNVYMMQQVANQGFVLTLQIIQQLFEILLPGCNGVIHKDDLQDRIPLSNYKKALDFIVKSMEKEHGIPPEGYHGNENPPPMEEDYEGRGDGHPHTRDEL